MAAKKADAREKGGEGGEEGEHAEDRGHDGEGEREAEGKREEYAGAWDDVDGLMVRPVGRTSVIMPSMSALMV